MSWLSSSNQFTNHNQHQRSESFILIFIMNLHLIYEVSHPAVLHNLHKTINIITNMYDCDGTQFLFLIKPIHTHRKQIN